MNASSTCFLFIDLRVAPNTDELRKMRRHVRKVCMSYRISQAGQ